MLRQTFQPRGDGFNLLALALVLSVAFHANPRVTGAGEAVRLGKDEIIAKLRQRQSQFRTVQVRWSETQTTNTGRTITVDDVRFVRDGNKMRYECLTSGNAADDGRVPSQRTIVSTFNGRESRDFMPAERQAYAVGTIPSGKQYKDLDSPNSRSKGCSITPSRSSFAGAESTSR